MNKKEHFWKMKELYPEGYGYGQFSKSHIALICLTFACSIFISYLYKITSSDTNNITRLTIALCLILMDMIKICVVIFSHGDLKIYLPLELCSFGSMFIAIDALIKESSLVTSMVMIVSIPAAIMAILFPTTVEIPVFSFHTIHQFSFHGLMIAYAMMRFNKGECILKYTDVLYTTAVLVAIVIIVYFIDSQFDLNYMFLYKDDDSAILKRIIEITGGGYKYIGCLIVMAFIAMNFYYLLFKMLEKLIIY